VSIVASDLVWYLSGGASNSDPNAALGGAISSHVWAGGTKDDIFDDISAAENAASTVDYRCVYIKNTHATITLSNASVWFNSQVAGGATMMMGLDPAGVNGTATTIANETTAPSGVTFSLSADQSSGLIIGNLAPGASQAVWLQRTAANTSGLSGDGFTIAVSGGTT
jgi:hypothetical protein